MRYTPGGAVAIVGDDIAVLVDVGPDEPLVGELFACVSARPAMEDLLEVLVGHGLRRLPSFAIAAIGADGVRVVVRGDFSANPDGQEPVRGSGLWTDRELGELSGLVLSASAAGSGPQLPLAAGVVLAAAVVVRAAEVAQVGEPAPAAAAGLESVAPDPVVVVPVVPAAVVPEPVVPEPVVPEPVVPEPVAPEPVAPEPVVVVPEPVVPVAVVPEPVIPELAVSTAAWPDFSSAEPVVPVPEPEVPAPGGLLIESFPWARDSEVPPAPVSEPEPLPVEIGMRAEPLITSPDPAPERQASAFDQEASEMTVDRSRLIERNSQSSVLVVAARCPSGHLSPAYAAGCRVCHEPLPAQQPVEVPRPQLGVLRLSNGDTVPLDRGVILGRNPRLPAGYSGEQPNLVRLSDPGKDVSSQHLEVRLDYWHVLVTDLGSTNGTEVILPGRPPVQLRPDDPLNIEPGTRVVLAGVLDFVFEVTG